MKRLRLSTLLSLTGAIAAGALLFWTSQNVQQSENHLHHLQKSIKNETQTIHVLHAEWDYLNRPDRIEALAVRHLGMSSASNFSPPDEISTLPDLFIPVRPQHKPFLKAAPIVTHSSEFSVLLRKINAKGERHE